jgi:hypothetical protein
MPDCACLPLLQAYYTTTCAANVFLLPYVVLHMKVSCFMMLLNCFSKTNVLHSETNAMYLTGAGSWGK